MISEDKLIGWLVFFRHQSVYEAPRVFLPAIISDALVAHGWMEREAETDWEGDYPSRFTEAGLAVSDLHAPEWGIDPLFVEEADSD